MLPLLLGPAGGWAQEFSGDQERRDLLALLEEQTEIATRTKLNADYVPGMVSVLYGEDLLAKGARTVGEALTFVPDVEVTIDREGTKQLVVRGVSSGFTSGNVKVLVNDVSVNSAEKGLANPVFHIPLQQVERIDVIRGPGSAIYGEYAYVGVINVITRRDEKTLFAGAETFPGATAGAVWSWKPEGAADWSMDLNIAATRTDGADVHVAQDFTYVDPSLDQDLSHAPGPANEEGQTVSAFFGISLGATTLQAQFMDEQHGDHFGINQILPPDPDHLAIGNRIGTLTLAHEFQPAETMQANASIGWSYIRRKQDDTYLGAEFVPEVLDFRYEQQSLRANASLVWEAGRSHRLLVGAQAEHIQVTDSFWSFEELFALPPNVSPDMERDITSVTLQDEYGLSESVNITAGLRYDHYSDVGSSVTPRISTVWRATERHIFKAQYAQAFRPPTFHEEGLNENLQARGTPTEAIEPATSDTVEVGYIYKATNIEGRLTIFEMELEDLVAKDPVTDAFINAGSGRIRGVEAEGAWRLGSAWKVDGNVSYTGSDNFDSGAGSAPVPRWLVNAGLVYRSAPDTNMALRYRHAGPFQREEGDPRDPMSPYDRVDLTLTRSGFLNPNGTLRVGITNLLDQDVRHPANLDLGIPGYPDDFPRPGRTGWIAFSYGFR